MTDLADLELVALDDVWVARLRGEIDLSNADSIATAVEQVFGREGIGVVVDLTGVEYLDSAGVRLLFRIARSSERDGWAMRAVVPAQSPVRRILDLTDVPGAIQLDESEETAVREIRSASVPNSEGVRQDD